MPAKVGIPSPRSILGLSARGVEKQVKGKMMNKLAERAVLMRFSAGLPGKHRGDKKTTAEVKAEKNLGKDSGKWVKDLYPEHALKALSQKQGEARAYHDSVTLPFGVKGDDAGDDSKTPAIAGIGILPAALIMEYGDKMRVFRDEVQSLLESGFLANPEQWISWARQEHNGTFDPANYPGCSADAFDADKFREVMRKKVYLRTEPLPVPDAEHFSAMVGSLLGTDVESVNIRVRDSATEAARELMRRLTEPVRAMAVKLAEAPKEGKDCPIFRDTLVGNIQDIAKLAPVLNLTGDAQIDAFTKEVEALTRYSPDVLRSDEFTRKEAARKADEIAKRMSSYKL